MKQRTGVSATIKFRAWLGSEYWIDFNAYRWAKLQYTQRTRELQSLWPSLRL